MKDLTCVKCGIPTTKKFTPDLDVTGIGMCDDHEEEIKLDLLVTQFDSKGWEKFEKKYLSNKKKK
jgi:hypothetical protein